MVSLLKSYNEFVIEHIREIGFVETLLQGGFNFFPSRFSNNSEVQTESVYALVNLLSLYHDCVLLIKQRKELQQINLHSKFDDRTFKIYPSWWEAGSVTLSAISAIQLFIEIFARSKRRRWHAIFSVELVKVIIRLWLLSKCKGSVLARQRTPNREQLLLSPPRGPTQFANAGGSNRETLLDVARKNLNTPQSSWKKYWNSQFQQPSSSIHVPTMPTTNRTLGEVLYIIRPLIYVYCLMKYDRKSWTPWLVSFWIELLSIVLVKSQPTLNAVEKEELYRRYLGFSFYLIRSPFYEKILKNTVKTLTPGFVQRGASRLTVPLNKIIETYRELYYYTSS